MDFSTIINELNQASLFELYRLNSAIWDQLEDPKRIRLIKNALKIGQAISYFDRPENRLVNATILELKRTKVLVKNECDGKLWNLSYYLINIDNVDINVHKAQRNKIKKTNVKVGDRVCFKDKKGNERFGEIVKLNPKTAGVLVGQGQWRVAYGLLSPVIEGETASEKPLIEGVVLDKQYG